jgi:CDP-paratose 2-epimerase
MTEDARMRAPGIAARRPILVTGGAGFIGCNLADQLAREGHDVLVYDALARAGVETNMTWLKKRHPERITTVIGDIRDDGAVADAARDASAVLHFAAQVAVTTSLVEPREDFDINIRGTLNLLEALRQRNQPVPLLFASTNKVYGDLLDVALDATNDAYVPRDPSIRAHGISEERPLDFHTPYGCSKGAADQYVLDYARSFGVPTVVMRMSCIYGPRQMGTEDQGWVAHFLIRALQGEPISIYGDGRQVRDIMHVSDAVAAYLAAWRRIEAIQGRAFNLGGGPANAVSLRQLLRHIEDLLGRPVDLAFSEWRAGDQRYYVSDTRRAARELGLAKPTPWRTGVAGLARWLDDERDLGVLSRAPVPERRLVGAQP